MTDSDIQKKLSHSAPIYRIVLTGGPCAGKSTLLSQLQSKLQQRTGMKVYCVPEAATLLVAGGLEWNDMNHERIIEFQLALLRVQLTLEDQLYAIARATGKPSLIVSDRGTMDGRAYCSAEQFQEILLRGGWTLEKLRDERYDAVVHMVSAAIGAPEYYNMDNPARFENLEEAVEADERLRQMYIGHPCLRVFDNATDFESKLDRVMKFVGHVIGHEFPHNLTRKFSLKKPLDTATISIPFVRARITVTVLHNSREEEVMQVMKREQDSVCIYFYVCIKHTVDGPATKSEHRISAREYASLLQQRDPSRVDIVKDNVSFVHKSHYCEVATFIEPAWAKGQTVLYVDCENSEQELNLPSFLEVDHEKTSQPSSFHVSMKCNLESPLAAAVSPTKGKPPKNPDEMGSLILPAQ